MTKHEAIIALRPFGRYKVSAVFDEVSHLMNAAMPEWEYPDWDWRLVREFIQEAEKGIDLYPMKKQATSKSPKSTARRIKEQIYRDLGLTKVRGALGGTYWE
jgi:hypothetical protein